MSFFNELKRRNVIRMGLLYIVASWVLLRIADVLFDPLGLPEWAFRLVLGLLMLGFAHDTALTILYNALGETERASGHR